MGSKRNNLPEIVEEFHYGDGDVGAHPGSVLAEKVWECFSRSHAPSHILIRPDTEEGQRLSDVLHAAIRTHERLAGQQKDDRLTADTVTISKQDLASLLDMAKDHVNDIETGLEEGLYEADENQNIGEKRQLVDRVDALYREAAMPQQQSTLSP